MKHELILENGKKYIKIPFYKKDGVSVCFSKYEENMLETDQIDGIAKIIKRVMDGEIYYLFTISGYISVKDFFSKGILTKELFGELFEELLQLFEKMKTHLLDGRMLCLEPEYIFYDEKYKRYIFLPIADCMERTAEKYEKLFTFFADVCPIEEKELLEYIFESFGSINHENFEEISFIKDVVEYSYKKEKKQEVMPEYEEEIFKDTEDDETEEEPKIKGIFIISLLLLLLSFWFSYVCKYEFKNGIAGMAAVLLAIGLMVYEVVKILRSQFKTKDI